ncbi:MAG: hypothetical protein KKG92_07895 [Gammaproteobacteria bacterium]|nr:hypothetical protein [Gammaproteobacteria bacterium]
MNHIHRTIWSRVLGNWVVAHEHAKQRGNGGSSRVAALTQDLLGGLGIELGWTIKPLALALFCVSFSPLALALPEGGVISGGAGNIAISGDIMTITQETARLSADFQRFNIAAPETVRAIQPDSSSVALFRVLGNDPSAI